MNPISIVVWTLEDNCWLVYLTLTGVFFYYTYYCRRQGAPHSTTANDLPPPQLQAQGTAADALRKEPEPRDDEDPERLQSAIPEDTPHVPFRAPRTPDDALLARSGAFLQLMAQRRTVRAFSPEPVPQRVLDNIVSTAGTAPSGAHTEPWTFVVVQEPGVKAAIRAIVEEEEERNYLCRMARQWVADLRPFATRPLKPYLTEAPALLLVFRQTHSRRADGHKRMHYYSEASVAIAAGFILAAVHYCGLVALTSTPLNCSPRVRALLARPPNERLELLMPVGHPHPQATVPDLARKPLDQIAVNF